MLPEIATLLILQERDQRLRRLRQDVRRVPEDEARAKWRLAGDEAALKAAKDAAAANEMSMKKLDLDVETRKTTIGRLKTQQFETRKNDEFRALEHEIDRYNLEVTKLEDEQLVFMEKGEELRKATAAAVATLGATKKLVEEELAQLIQRKVNAEAQIAELEVERKDLVVKVEPTLLNRYDRIFDKKAPAVVPLQGGICGGCHMKITPATLTAVKGEKAVSSCEQCGRILYFGE